VLGINSGASERNPASTRVQLLWVPNDCFFPENEAETTRAWYAPTNDAIARKSHHPTFTNEMNTVPHLPDTATLSGVLFTDKCAIYNCTHDRDVSVTNPHFTAKFKLNPPHVMLWAGMAEPVSSIELFLTVCK